MAATPLGPTPLVALALVEAEEAGREAKRVESPLSVEGLEPREELGVLEAPPVRRAWTGSKGPQVLDDRILEGEARSGHDLRPAGGVVVFAAEAQQVTCQRATIQLREFCEPGFVAAELGRAAREQIHAAVFGGVEAKDRVRRGPEPLHPYPSTTGRRVSPQLFLPVPSGIGTG